MSNIENEIEPSADYLKGFNEGYLISKERPELAETIIKNVQGDTERLNGFMDGNKQFAKEMEKTYTLTWSRSELTDYGDKNMDKDKDVDMDKDDPEPEL